MSSKPPRPHAGIARLGLGVAALAPRVPHHRPRRRFPRRSFARAAASPRARDARRGVQRLLGPLLSLYQIHSATLDSPVLGDQAVLDELARLRDRGIRIGITVSGTAQGEVIRRALAVARGGSPLFESVQATWNLLERSAEPALREARAAGRVVIVKEPLANGRLTPRGDAAHAGPLADAARAAGRTVDATALAAAIAQPWASVVLLGAATPEQLASNLVALRRPISGALLETLAPLREDATSYWRRRATLPWT